MSASGGRPSAAESVTVTGLTKAFGASPVLRGVDLTVPAGALVALLGPSGCGKTTLLRAIAGLERPDSGEVRVGDRVLAGPGVAVPPERRRIGMVFQDPALFPHMSVARNVGYGLSRRDPDRTLRVAAGARRWSAWADTTSACPPPSPAASSSGWPSRGRWRRARR